MRADLYAGATGLIEALPRKAQFAIAAVFVVTLAAVIYWLAP